MCRVRSCRALCAAPADFGRRSLSRRSQPPLALSVPLSRFTSRVGGGSAFFVRHHRTSHNKHKQIPMKKQVVRISILQSSKIITPIQFLVGFIYTLIGIPMKKGSVPKRGRSRQTGKRADAGRQRGEDCLPSIERKICQHPFTGTDPFTSRCRQPVRTPQFCP
jgi:hypothetical protein